MSRSGPAERTDAKDTSVHCRSVAACAEVGRKTTQCSRMTTGCISGGRGIVQRNNPGHAGGCEGAEAVQIKTCRRQRYVDTAALGAKHAPQQHPQQMLQSTANKHLHTTPAPRGISRRNRNGRPDQGSEPAQHRARHLLLHGPCGVAAAMHKPRQRPSAARVVLHDWSYGPMHASRAHGPSRHGVKPQRSERRLARSARMHATSTSIPKTSSKRSPCSSSRRSD
jgi:hypothetical protein